MKSLKKVWNVAIQRGISLEDTPGRRIALRATNTTLLISIPFYPIYILISILSRHYFLALAISISFTVHLSTYIMAGYIPLNLKARWLAMFNANFIIFISALVIGRNTGIEYYFISLACLVFMTFEKTEEISIFFFVLLSITLFILSQHFILLPNTSSVTLTYFEISILRLISFLIASGLCFLTIGFMKDYYNLAQEELDQERSRKIHESRLTALGEMASIIAHEIKSPLAALDGLNEMALDHLKASPTSPPEVSDLLQRSKKMIERLHKIISTLALYTRKAEKDSFVVATLQKIIDESLILFENQFKYRNITSHISIDPPNLSISCREIQIVQVLVNLIQNSMDAIQNQENSWIKITATLEAPGKVKISVSDSGLTEQITNPEQIFSPFHTSKPAGKGTGLGLSVSKDIIKAHGGELFLDLQAEHTTFVILFNQKTTEENLTS